MDIVSSWDSATGSDVGDGNAVDCIGRWLC